MAIKTREFWTSSYSDVRIDDLINGFTKENPDIEIVDIKYQTEMYEGYGIRISALIIYKEEEE